jgi:thiosulfate reductase/polysulfide reductase chain A
MESESPHESRPGNPDPLSRRDVLRAGAAFAAGSLLQGCPSSPKAPPTPPTPGPGAAPLSGPNIEKVARRVIDYAKTKARPTTCFGCTTQCHVLGWVQDERVVRITGHPLDPSSRGKTCAKADGLISSTYSPSRLLHPLRRSGPRGSGKWERISWEDALDSIAKRIRKLMDEKRPDLFAIQVGRDKTQGLIGRFLNTVGSPNGLNRRSICSTNNRLGTMTYFGTAMDWGAPDLERTSFVLNFGSNLMEAHQGGFGASAASWTRGLIAAPSSSPLKFGPARRPASRMNITSSRPALMAPSPWRWPMSSLAKGSRIVPFGIAGAICPSMP